MIGVFYLPVIYRVMWISALVVKFLSMKNGSLNGLMAMKEVQHELVFR
jgi:ABC-type polysaccharide transport system permease subunit